MAMKQPLVDTLYTTLYNGYLKDNFVPAGKRFFYPNSMQVWDEAQWAAAVASAGSDAQLCLNLNVQIDERDGY